MHLIISLVIGGVIGWLASLVMKTNAQMGVIANVIVGVIGSGLGHWIAGILGIFASGIGSWLVSLGGAVVLIVLLQKIGLFKKA